MVDAVLNYIDGELRPATSGETFDNINPWTQEVISSVAKSSADDVDVAVKSARKAFDEGPWPRMTPEERAALLHRFGDIIEQHADEVAMADTLDMGNPIKGTRTVSAPRAAENFRFFADQVVHGVSENYPRKELAYVRFEPAGVVGAVAPWNYPIIQETWKVAPALAYGNTCVLKPAEDSPTSAVLVAEMATEAGIPNGVFNVVQGFGAGAAGEALVEHSMVDRITFTGEAGTGRAISTSAAKNLTPVSLELGGKGATIVFDDADMDTAVPLAVQAAFMNSGQLCLAGPRLFVHESIFDDFLSKFVAATEALVIGDPADNKTDIGPLSSGTHFKKVESYLAGLTSGEGKIVTGGKVACGWTIEPTVVVGLDDQAPACQEEIFGPIVTVSSFSTESEVLERANNVQYGLTSSLFTNDLGRIERIGHALNVGTVWVNSYLVRDLRAPFGGYKNSGIGREGGNFSRDFFTEQKMMIIGFPK